jgi:hypothetical protein
VAQNFEFNIKALNIMLKDIEKYIVDVVGFRVENIFIF